MWTQREITLPAYPRGFHLITRRITAEIPEISEFGVGMLHLLLQHTSASLTLNENASPEVRKDMESVINTIVPEAFPYQHSLEGADDMPAHIKSSLFGPSLLLPVSAGRLALGVWQGIYLCEHRNHGGSRRLVATLWGESS